MRIHGQEKSVWIKESQVLANQLYETVVVNKDVRNKAGKLRMLRQITELLIKELVKLVQDSMSSTPV